MARRLFFGMAGSGKTPLSDPHVYDPGAQTKIDALVRMYTGFRSMKELCRNNPTLRAPPGASNRTKKHFAKLRKAYRLVTGKEPVR